MIFTDGQLLTADDINNFLLNRENNPELDEVKRQALQRIDELKNSIPPSGKPLTTLPLEFKTDEVLQAWKLAVKRNSQEEFYKHPSVLTIAPSIEGYPQFISYDPASMRVPLFCTRMDKNHEYCPFEYYSRFNQFTGFKYKKDFSLGKLTTVHFITIAARIGEIKLKYDPQYYDSAVIEEVPDDLTKLRHQ